MTLLQTEDRVPIELADLRESRRWRAHDKFRVGLLIPLCGPAGIWSPSAIASAQVAVAELNQRGGILGRRVELVMIDSALEAPEPLDRVVNDLIEAGAIDAIVGMHISAVRQTLSKVVRQRVPFIYTPLYEGGETTPGLFAIGETPPEQLGPAMRFLQDRYRPRKWALIGNDYVWPRSSHSYAKHLLRELGGELALERYLPFGFTKVERLLDELAASGAEAVVVSFIGQDAVTFNRAFGRRSMQRQMVRLALAIEENTLLATGPRALERLFVSSSYFGVLATEANAAFKERYHAMHGERAPVLGALGQSTYEGVHFLAGLMRDHAESWRDKSARDGLPVRHKSSRASGLRSGLMRPPIYLARADGLRFEVIKEFEIQ